MADETHHARAERLLKRPPDAKPVGAVVEPQKLEALGPKPEITGEVPFSVFNPAHQELAVQIAARLMELTNEEGLDAALEYAEKVAEETSTELAQYALMIFITHHPKGQELPIPPLEERAPEHVKPTTETPRETAELEALGATGDEAALDWYREDASANAHHERWHVVYPFGGIPDSANPRRRITKDRQGELFMYMHEQMLARYDTERLCAGLSAPVSRYSNFNDEIPEGYFPMLPRFDNRRPDSLLGDNTQVDVAQLEGWSTALFNDIPKRNATLRRPNNTTVAATPDNIGGTIESSIGSVNTQRYGNLHNMGHVAIAFIPDPQQTTPQRGGVMISTSTAIRDPIFYRWHRQVDELVYQWQDKLDAQSFGDAPRVTIRDVLSGTARDGASPDIAVVLASRVTGDPQQFGNTNFGGNNWNSDAGASSVAASTIKTTMRQRRIGSSTVQYLDHEDYFYFIRASNDTNAEQTVTVRIFLAANEWVDERREWIELDKFQQKLAAGRNVIARSSKLSSVVRKPAMRPGEPAPPREPGSDPNYCDCGWPYHLLLPRGTRAGRSFRLLVVMTAWDLDRVEVEGKCGSMSFCGKKDAAYPDRRPMGYPFDRKWTNGISKTILAQKNMAARDIRIQWT